MPAAAQLEPCPGCGSTSGDGQPGPGRPPGDGQADDPATGHHQVGNRGSRHGPMLRAVRHRPTDGASDRRPGRRLGADDRRSRRGTCTIFRPRKGQRRPGRVDPLLSLERPDDDLLWQFWNTRPRPHDPCPHAPPPGSAAAPVRPRGGLYDPRFEHDACGVALVADLQGRATHTLVRQAISALEHLAHRGATGSEEDSGDGAGILIQIPHNFYADIVDFDLPARGTYATGLAFLSRDGDEADGRAGPSTSWPGRRASRSSAGGRCPSTTPPSARSPRRPCPPSTRSSWPRPPGPP